MISYQGRHEDIHYDKFSGHLDTPQASAQEEAGVAVGEEAVVAGEGVVIDATPFAEEG